MAGRGHLEEFGQRLRRLRLEAGLTQEDLAEVADCSIGAVGKLERGSTSPSVATLLQFCRALNVDPHALLGWESDSVDPLPPPDELSEIVELRHRIAARLKECDLEAVRLVEGVVLYAWRRQNK